MLFKVRNIHFFHVVAVVFDCGYYFVDVGVVVADYFGQTRSRDDRTFSRQPLFLRRRSRATRTYRQRAKIFFFILSLLSFFCPYCKLNFPACQQNMNKISHFVYLCHSDCLFDSIYISFLPYKNNNVFRPFFRFTEMRFLLYNGEKHQEILL